MVRKIMLGLGPERKLKYPFHQHEIKLSGGGSEVSLSGNLLLVHQWHNQRSQPPELQLGSTSTALMVMTGTEAIMQFFAKQLNTTRVADCEKANN
ncbi:hypothetical protein Bca52824_033679 [Brassica carinata]|uniref:Uncharacterized protein n=1 Tax=Brassica carinata TaxID=52824 RepID=A0A8X7SF59_BRACI|nr:hypothetical protein Bca52824_033679 [Brassica carinata]